jgi:hypothetical protein
MTTKENNHIVDANEKVEDARSGWVSVKQRLPVPQLAQYLLLLENGLIVCGPVIPNKDITHWMELPKSPGGE